MARHVVQNVERKGHIGISFHSIRFTGLRTINMEGLLVTNEDTTSSPGDTLIQLRKLNFRPAILPLFTGKIRLSMLEADSGKLTVTGLYQLILSYRRSEKHTENQKPDHGPLESETVLKWMDARNIDKIFGVVPAKMRLNELLIELSEDSVKSAIYCREMQLLHQKWSGKLMIHEGVENTSVLLNGSFVPSDRSFSMEVSGEPGKVFIPGLKAFGFSKLAFNTLNIDSRFTREKAGIEWLDGTLRTTGFELEAEDLNTEPIRVNDGSVLFKARINHLAIETDSNTQISFNGFSFYPTIFYQPGPSGKLLLEIKPVNCEAQEFFNAVPDGLFDHFRGISVSGRLNYFFKATLDFEVPDSSDIISSLTGTGFRINHFGKTDLAMLNDSFTLAVYDDDQHFVRWLKVGPGNPDFVPLPAISPLLINAVLTSEDGSFFYHHGFNLNAIRDAMIEDIRKKRFARGGSTISMQLVKNVFLSKDKNLTRKLEEALMVWIIETQHLVSKERMLEVYLNIIEWGPGIYGIREASRYYFDKEPAALNLQESMFLAYIIPRPSSFRFAFEHNGRLRSYMENYFQLLEYHLLERKNISPEDTAGLHTELWLKGPAAAMLKQENDTAIAVEQEGLEYRFLLPAAVSDSSIR